MHIDVIVVGAGPSGLSAARTLAEAGLDVIVLESKDEVGKHVVCTGIIGREAFQRFELSKALILKEINKIKVTSPYGNSLAYEHHHPFAYVVDREKFDKYLARKSQTAGAVINLGNKVIDISINNNHVEVLTEIDGNYREKHIAKLVIIATGVNYRMHKKLQLGYPKDFLKGVQAEFELENVEYPCVFIGKDIAPGAFAWIVPVGRKRVKIGLMTEKNPRQCFSYFMERFFPGEMKTLGEKKVHFKPIAQGLVSKTYGERVLAIGEAAGQVKTTTGGGVYFGLVCSEIAANVILECFKKGNFSSKAIGEYEKLWKKTIQKEMLLGYYARKLCGKMSNHQMEKIFQIAKNDGVIPLIRNRGDFDWHSDLILALFKRLPVFSLLVSSKQ